MQVAWESLPKAETTATSTQGGNRALSQTEFMTLFITQLQNQDPLKPMDSFEMAQQMAMFSNVEALYNMNETMEELLAYQTSQNNLQLLSLLDKTVQAVGNLVAVVGGETRPTQYVLEGPAETCVAHIYDIGGRLVRTIDLGVTAQGTYELDWDGKDSLGRPVEDGAYQYVIEATDFAGGEVTVQPRTTGKVSGLDFDGGKAMLTLDGFIHVDVGEITKVM